MQAYAYPIVIVCIQQTKSCMELMDSIANWVAALAALGALGVAIWGAKRILSELKLRAMDSMGGFYARLKAQLIVLEMELGSKDENSFIALYSVENANELSPTDKPRLERIQQQIALDTRGRAM